MLEQSSPNERRPLPARLLTALYWRTVKMTRKTRPCTAPIRRWLNRRRSNSILRHFPEVHRTELLFPRDNIEPQATTDWIFHNETWDRVVNRFSDRERVNAGKPVTADDVPSKNLGEFTKTDNGALRFSAKSVSSDEWIYIHLDSHEHSFGNVSWECRIRRDTDFREFQFGFRYVDFYNRYRIRFESDVCFFDIVHNGQFLNGLAERPCPLAVGQWYHLRIDVIDHLIRCLVNDKPLVAYRDTKSRFDSGSIAIILWESRGSPNIEAQVADIKVWKIERPTSD